MPEMVKGIKMLSKDLFFYKACALAKSYKQHKKGPAENRAIKFFRQIHINIYSGGKTFSAAGNKYYLIFTDDVSRWKQCIFLKKKFDAPRKLKN